MEQQFELLQVLRRDQYSVTFLAQHSSQLRFVKVIDLKNLPETVASLLQRDAKILALKAHPGVLRCLKSSVLDGCLVVEQEYHAGKTLLELLNERAPKFRFWRERQLIELANSLADALHFLHSNGLFHRDLCPRSVLEGPVLADLALSQVLESGNFSRVGQPKAPQPNKIPYDQKLDMYGLGVLLLSLMVLKPLLEFSEGQLSAALYSGRFKTLVAQLCSPRPESRPSAVEFRSRLALLSSIRDKVNRYSPVQDDWSCDIPKPRSKSFSFARLVNAQAKAEPQTTTANTQTMFRSTEGPPRKNQSRSRSRSKVVGMVRSGAFNLY